MKQIVSILVLIGLIVWGYLSVAGFTSYLLMIGLISALVIAHEFGHFYVAKKVGVKVERFGFGLPIGPTLLEKQVGETKFCLHPVLLGGYVSFPDDDPESDVPLDSPDRFENKPIPQRVAIAVAGVVVNLIAGYLIMVFVMLMWGYPGHYFVKIKSFINNHSPAQQAGLLQGDIFVKVAGQDIKTPSVLIDYLHSHKGQPVSLTVERGNALKTVTATPDKTGKIDVVLIPTHKYIPLKNPAESVVKAYTFLQEKMVQNFQAMGQVITGKRSGKEVSGPIGIIEQGGEMIQTFGISDGLVITALISVILGIMNILPIPMLDGGHLLFMFFEKLKGHPLHKGIQERITQFSFVILMGLMCVILWNDINTYILGK